MLMRMFVFLTSLKLGLQNQITSFKSNDEGQGMVEYALLIGLIAVVVIVALVAFGPAIRDFFTALTTEVTNQTPTP